MNVLLHTCCAPCATHCILALQEQGHAVTLFFSNANIAPTDEFHRRLEAVEHLATQLAVPLLVDPPDHTDWLKQVADGFEHEPEKGARCARCFQYSLSRTLTTLRQQAFERFTSTLTVSPHKQSATLFEIGHALDKHLFLPIDFKKHNGFKKSLELSARFGLYRQTYCGCEFSRRQEPSPLST